MKIIISFLLVTIVTAHAENVRISPELIQRLSETTLVNEASVIKALDLDRSRLNSPKSFKYPDPYNPPTKKELEATDDIISVNGITNFKDLPGKKVKFFHQPKVHEWTHVKDSESRQEEVCAFRFIDSKNNEYVLKSFANPDSALNEGYTITHQYHCGGCSSLKDLAIYLKIKNLTGPARICAKKLDLVAAKKCFQEEIGFTASCAETWAYNSRNTRKACMSTCVKDYGLWNLMTNQFPTEQNNSDGTLKPCIQCDELRSVPGWRYVAGRTRRGSGIISEIERDPNEIYPLDYRTYYELFDLGIPLKN
jgi:hypothetical protein